MKLPEAPDLSRYRCVVAAAVLAAFASLIMASFLHFMRTRSLAQAQEAFVAEPFRAAQTNAGPKQGVTQVTSQAATQARLVESYGRLPLSFELNQGQTDSRVKFLSRGRG